LTGEALARLLACLDDDVEAAGEKYEVIRRKLVKFFDWRGAHFPEECADETINRIIRKLDSGETIRDIPTYCAGIARLVFLETLKKADRHQVSLDEWGSIAAPAPQPEENAQQTCFERCLNELPIESRRLILQYYQDERRRKIDNRQALADSLGVPLNALRSRVQRIRDKLEQCVTSCLGSPLPPRRKN
jgi:RNA polymerase sigma factor (sigma-70 family)